MGISVLLRLVMNIKGVYNTSILLMPSSVAKLPFQRYHNRLNDPKRSKYTICTMMKYGYKFYRHLLFEGAKQIWLKDTFSWGNICVKIVCSLSNVDHDLAADGWYRKGHRLRGICMS